MLILPEDPLEAFRSGADRTVKTAPAKRSYKDNPAYRFLFLAVFFRLRA